MEELDSCIKEWLYLTAETAFNSSNRELLKFWLDAISKQSNDSTILNCTGYAEQFGWNDSNSNDYKYFANESLRDVVSRKLALFADNYIIAIG